MNNLWLVIPVKPFDEGKARLSPVLNIEGRCALNRRFYHHVLTTGLEVFTPERILVLSRSEEVRASAMRKNVRFFKESAASDLNSALAQATAYLLREDAKAMLVLSCDLPCLCTNDLRDMIAACQFERGVTIACDENEEGTNALLMAPPGLIEFCYGAGSFKEHLHQTRRLGIEPAVLRRPGLAFDVDTPAHLEHLAQVVE